jgi:hypothetical protein
MVGEAIAELPLASLHGRQACARERRDLRRFITGSHDAFVIEDADHLLMARANGNVDLHRFLAVADGVVRAQGRKIIFTNNLPNVGDIDEALVRPGRCFATVRTRPLQRSEAESLLARPRARKSCSIAYRRTRIWH